MCAPLLDNKGECVGVIQLDTLQNEVGFTDEDLEIIVTVAMQASIAIENAKLHQNALRQQALRHELELANEVQHRLLPRDPPELDRYDIFDYYRPADQIGGDYFDYVQLNDGRLAILIADVVGHGVAAALLMAKFSADARFALASTAGPGQALTLLNRSISHLQLDRFITLLVVMLDLKNSTLTIVNAGHPPPMIRHAAGNVTQLDSQQSGLPIGVYEDTEYSEVPLSLAAGESLILYTDGITEGVDAEERPVGMKGLQEIIESCPSGDPQQLGQHIVRLVRQRIGDRQEDDICLVCLGRR
jgi:serine phosphatase RsbU (regulator of sigma subunit)